MKPRLVIKLPFPGFYDSWYSDELHHIEEMEVENSEELERENHAPEIRLETDDIVNAFNECHDWATTREKTARAFVDAFRYVLADNYEIQLDIEYESMSSPRFYNFETDRVFAHITRRSVANLWRINRADRFESFRQVLKERHTSRSGFISFYDNDARGWFGKPLSRWDHNELESLLIAAVRVRGGEKSDLDWHVFNHVCEGDGLFDEFNHGMDWRKLDSLLAERRAEIVADLRAKDPTYVPPTERCAHTSDMFAGRT